MTKRFTDFSQLTKAIIKPKDEPKPIPAPEPKEEVQSREDADAAAVLAYFSRPAQNAPRRPSVASNADSAKDRSVATEAELKAKDAARAKLVGENAAANRPTGELERRRAELKQILKDAGGFTDASTLAALERIGIRCISGRKHRKLEYADIRMPMSKTPSDCRSAQNCATDMANRCF